MNNTYFVLQAKHNKTNDTWDKGVVIKNNSNEDNKAAALQTYHAYLGAYGYGNNNTTDYVFCQIIDASNGLEVMRERWAAPQPIPEPETPQDEEEEPNE